MEKAYGKQPRILIADDLQKNIQVIGTILRKEGFQINVAVNGKQALDLAEKTVPDLILMDICLNDEVDGISIAAQLRSVYTVPIVFITAYADKGIIRRAKSVEPDGYIVKPYSEDSIYANIEIALHCLGGVLKDLFLRLTRKK